MSTPGPDPAARRRRTALARGVGTLVMGLALAGLAVALLPLRPWEDDGSEAWAMTVFIVTSVVNLLLAIVIAAQSFAIARRQDTPGSAGGAGLLTVLSAVLLVVGAALAFLRGVPDGAGPYVLGVQVLFGIWLVVASAANGRAARGRV